MARARKRKLNIPEPTSIPCPFKIIVETNEYLEHHNGYKFENITSNANNRYLPYDIEIETRNLKRLGDYSLDYLDSSEKHMPKCIIERKSKEDFFGSMAKRDNFEERLAQLCEETQYAAVVVEAEWSEMGKNPPQFSSMDFTAIHRTVQSWTIEYSHVHWFFYPGRDAAESATFWLLYRFYEKLKKHQTDKERKTENYAIYHEGMRARVDGIHLNANPYPRARTVGDKADFWFRGFLDMCDILKDGNVKGKTKCSEPPVFPNHIFSKDFTR